MHKSLSKMDQVMTIYGYARVSTKDQTLASQDAQLHAAGCAKVFAEKISGAKSDRPELKKVLKTLGQGDVLIVTRLDRLARSTRDLLNILAEAAKLGAGFKSLAEVWADTTTSHGRLMLTVLGGLAEFERDLILARTSDGRTRAQARGVKFGRKPILTARRGRSAGRRGSQLRRVTGDNLAVTAEPFRRRGGRVRRKRK
jgi:DNA invertase Pin-like site-specific DNA recombinase